MKLKFERLSPTAKLPKKAYKDDAGIDLFSDSKYTIKSSERVIIKTGIKIAIPEGFAGLIWDKGGVAKDGIHTIAGVIDSGFRGELAVILVNLSDKIYNISSGQKVAQLLIQKIESLEIIEEEIDDKTDRSKGRFGSSKMF